jgi:hypothetical protein
MSADFLCANAILIADGDIATKGKRKREYEEMLGERLIVLPAKEIENLIPQEVIQKLLKDNPKAQNILSIDYSKPEIAIGRYLDDTLGLSKYVEDSGTIKDKLNFCQKCVAIMESPDFEWKLSPKLEKICKQIFEHIEKENR